MWILGGTVCGNDLRAHEEGFEEYSVEAFADMAPEDFGKADDSLEFDDSVSAVGNSVDHTAFDSERSGDRVIRIVALGDSYASGHNAGKYLDPSNSGGSDCKRSMNAYAYVNFDELKTKIPANTTLEFASPACSGSKTSNVLNGGGKSPVQVDEVNKNTRLVTLQVGGNDVGFKEIIEKCMGTLGCDHRVDEAVDEGIPKAQEGIKAILDKINSKTDKATVVLLGYTTFWDGGSCGIGSFKEYQRDVIDEGIRKLNQAINDACIDGMWLIRTAA